LDWIRGRVRVRVRVVVRVRVRVRVGWEVGSRVRIRVWVRARVHLRKYIPAISNGRKDDVRRGDQGDGQRASTVLALGRNLLVLFQRPQRTIPCGELVAQVLVQSKVRPSQGIDQCRGAFRCCTFRNGHVQVLSRGVKHSLDEPVLRPIRSRFASMPVKDS
jgi:hypothetical protein